MIGWSLVVVALATLTGLPHKSHGMKMDVDGGYRDIVIKVAGDRSVPEEMCPKIISNIKVRLQNRFSPYKSSLINFNLNRPSNSIFYK